VRRRGLIALLALLVAALAFAAAGCGGEETAAPPPPAEPAPAEPAAPPAETGAPAEEPAPAAPAFDLKIGNIMSFTGALSPYGPPIDFGAKIAADIITESLERVGLSDVTAEIVASEDDQTDAAPGVEAATKLVQSDGVQVIIGALASTVSLAVAESVTVPNQIVLISPASTSGLLTSVEDDGFLWRTPTPDNIQAELLVKLLGEAFGADATINVGARNDAYGAGLAEAFGALWEEAGGTIGASVLWNPDAPTFDTEAQELASGSPDGWLIIDFPETYAKFGPALVRTGEWDITKTFTTDGLALAAKDVKKLGPELTEGMRGTRPNPGVTPAPAADAFDAAFLERDTESVGRGTFDAQAFDAVMLAFLAALQAGSSDPAGIRDNLQAVSGPPGEQYTFEQLDDAINAVLAGEDIDYEGASGSVNLDENGDPGAEGSSYQFFEYKNGKLEPIDTFPYPFE
jgi:ABC-type branched-subunit amino acid transport system substrate-binding protein